MSVRVANGSSPHTRGALFAPRRTTRTAGIIPAYAGSTARPRITSRGTDGSSPHTRGAPPGLVRREGFRGDHPRIRGEHSLRAAMSVCAVGSSPHTRGARRRVGAVADPGGIIPAYAGSTRSVGRRRTGWTDHPRIRGEHVPVGVQGAGEAGSSPHTRGARPLPGAGTPRKGIIPAYAGSTTPPTKSPSKRADHPRIRGEHFLAVRSSPSVKGSSPHTRGARRPRWRRRA